MGDVSQHFSRREFACHHCGAVVLDPALVPALERLRTIIGNKPIEVVSGYRCPIHNRAVGGAPRSQHKLGKAADLKPGTATVAQAEQAGFKGIGNKGRWARHVDVRATKARWSY